MWLDYFNMVYENITVAKKKLEIHLWKILLSSVVL